MELLVDRQTCLDDCQLRPECVAECEDESTMSAANYAISILVTVVLLCMSGFFSGLTLGLMSLDMSGLELIEACGEAKQQKWARQIMPIRSRGNLLLCTLLLGNTAVNSFIAIFTAGLTAGTVGAVLSTAFILIFGEITPQSICSKHGLRIGAVSVPLVRVFIFLFYPLAWPISKILDFALGRELRTIYNRKELDKLLSIAVEDPRGDLRPEEKNIMTAALEFAEKRADMIMTKLDHTFCIDVRSKLSFDELLRCYKSGFTRIPVFKDDPSNVVGLLFAKDLILVDPDDEIPVGAMLSFCGRSVHTVRNDTTLDKLLTAAQTLRSHLFFVVEGSDESPTPVKRTPPVNNVIGIVTLEDVLEELIAAEIVDETDTIRDNQTRDIVNANAELRLKRMEFFYSIQAKRHPRRHVTEDELRAITTFLIANAQPFREADATHKSIRKLLTRCPVLTVEANHGAAPYQEPLYENGKRTSQCCLVLSGALRITTGEDDMESEAGPWSLLALEALTTRNYVPDYTATVMKTTRLLFISRAEFERMLTTSAGAGALDPADAPGEPSDAAAVRRPPSVGLSTRFDWDASHQPSGSGGASASMVLHHRRRQTGGRIPESKSYGDLDSSADAPASSMGAPQLARSQSHPDLQDEDVRPLCEVLAGDPSFVPRTPPMLRSLLSDSSVLRNLGASHLAEEVRRGSSRDGAVPGTPGTTVTPPPPPTDYGTHAGSAFSARGHGEGAETRGSSSRLPTGPRIPS
mmetsp:Transcript_2582/g.7605  ORF Transcript_2582/g.7605 Transcript_2582/m.7605 type:complete len:748 (+) Transcript_2582:102-2345(+)